MADLAEVYGVSEPTILEGAEVTGRKGFLREACALLERARQTEDPREAAELIRQAADMLVLVAELSPLHDPDVKVQK